MKIWNKTCDQPSFGRRRYSLQIQTLATTVENADDASNDALSSNLWSEASLDQLSKNYYKYRSESCSLNNESNPDDSVGDGLAKTNKFVQMPAAASGQEPLDVISALASEHGVWVWNNLSTRDKMRRKSVAAMELPRWVVSFDLKPFDKSWLHRH